MLKYHETLEVRCNKNLPLHKYPEVSRSSSDYKFTSTKLITV